MIRPLPLALLALVSALTWRTERFQAWAFPERYYNAQVARLVDDIAFQRAMIKDSQDELVAMRQRGAETPADAEVYLMLKHEKEEDIAAYETLIGDYQADLVTMKAALAKFRGNR